MGALSAPVGKASIDKRFSLFALACVLTDNPVLAEKLVRQTIVRGHMSFSGSEVVEAQDVAREFARQLYVSCCSNLELNPAVPLVVHPSGARDPSSDNGMLRSIRELPDDQRIVFALCAFGGHDCRDVAALLELPTPEVSELLRNAMAVLDTDH